MNENTINTQSRSVVAWGQKGRTGNDGREGLKEVMGMFSTSTVGMISHMYTWAKTSQIITFCVSYYMTNIPPQIRF